MKKEEKINYKIDSNVLKNYVKAINSIKAPMNQIKEQLDQLSKPMKELNNSINESLKPIQEELKSINTMSNVIKELSIKYPNEQAKILTDTIKQIMNTNNGMLSTRMIEPLNISRQYLSIMENIMILKKFQEVFIFRQVLLKIVIFPFNKNIKKLFSHI